MILFASGGENVQELQLKYNISYDNITLVGDLEYRPSKIMEFISVNPLTKQVFLNSKSRFHYNAVLEGGIFIQFSHDTDKEYKIRFEFNPNKVRRKYEKHLYSILGVIVNPHLTRKDIAIDLYDMDLSDGWNFYQDGKRKEIEYRSSTGRMESLYYGAPKSDERIRIYNKALEQKETDKTWWRVEAQLRSEKSNIPNYNPFNSIRIVRKGGYDNYDIRTRAMLQYLENNPDGLSELSPKIRKKYKEILMKNVESISLLLPFDNQECESELQSWLNYCPVEGKLHKWR